MPPEENKTERFELANRVLPTDAPFQDPQIYLPANEKNCPDRVSKQIYEED
jgi:hypothetical protein